MAYDAFLKIDGIEGESNDKTHKGEIELSSFSWGVSNAGCRGVGYYYRTDRGEVLDWIHSVVGNVRWSQITVS